MALLQSGAAIDVTNLVCFESLPDAHDRVEEGYPTPQSERKRQRKGCLFDAGSRCHSFGN
jgi:hypothetical protein